MRQIISEISKGNNIDDNLVKYADEFMSINNIYAYVRLAMNYFTYYQMIFEDAGILESENLKIINEINIIITESITNKNYDSIEKNIGEVEKIRKAIIENMQALTCYVDIFNIYEHAFNRVEYRFRDDKQPVDYSDEDYTRKIMQYLLSDEDDAIINSKICQIIGQLPIRMTRSKFFELLTTGIGVYKGSQKQSVNDFSYMIRTASMLEKTKKMSETFPELEDIFNDLHKIDFRSITKEQYEIAKSQLKGVSEHIENVMNSNMIMQELLNDLMIILYTINSEENDMSIRTSIDIIKNINFLFCGKIAAKTIEEVEEEFFMLEGVQESVYEKLSIYDITDKIKFGYSSEIIKNDLSEKYDIITKLTMLNSDSSFVELDKVSDSTEADEKYIQKISNDLIVELSDLFKNNQRQISRAVMCAVLAELPVFFNNISELQNYIYNALSVCTDAAEKLACIEIIDSMMEELDAL